MTEAFYPPILPQLHVAWEIDTKACGHLSLDYFGFLKCEQMHIRVGGSQSKENVATGNKIYICN